MEEILAQMARIDQSWLRREFKIALENAPEPSELKDLIQVVDVHKGELLWQGSAGLCIAKKDSKRNARCLA